VPWAYETKAGFAWAIAIVVVFLLSIWAMVVMHTMATLILPVAAYFGFLLWLRSVK